MRNRLLFLLVAMLAYSGFGQTLIMYDDFESADTACWASRPNAGGTEKWAGCNDPPLWAPLADLYGPPPGTIRVLNPSPYAYSGTAAAVATYPGDESLTKAQFNIPAPGEDHIFFSQRILFAPSFDFPFGLKVLRADMWDSVGDVSLSSFIVVVYNQGVGTHDMGGLTLTKNGGENYGYADGISFTPGTWHLIEVEIKLNTPCLSDGLARMWVDGVLVTSRTGMGGSDMRPSSCDTHHITFGQIGGWYSNSGVGPIGGSATKVYIDDASMSAQDDGPRWGLFGDDDIFPLKMGF